MSIYIISTVLILVFAKKAFMIDDNIVQESDYTTGVIKTNDKTTRRHEEKTNTTNNKRSDNNADNVNGKDLLSIKNDSRMATERPVIETGAFVAELPFLARNHSKHYKAEKREEKRGKRIGQRERSDGMARRVGQTTEERRLRVKVQVKNIYCKTTTTTTTTTTTEEPEILPPMLNLKNETRKFYKQKRWPRGNLNYILTEDTNYNLSDVRARIAAVKGILENRTCVRMKEITEKDAKKLTDYLVINTGPDFEYGRRGGRQEFGHIELYIGNQHRQHAAMLVMAMLGFHFELTRHDRFDNIKDINFRNIRKDKRHHYQEMTSDATFPLPYDYKSATHPYRHFWKRPELNTNYWTVVTGRTMEFAEKLGQNEVLLSESDILKINSVYGVRCFRRRKSKTPRRG